MLEKLCETMPVMDVVTAKLMPASLSEQIDYDEKIVD
jgi:hypothetical protein